jgi:DNA replicative helicase MCM subunit Mcm2 (Cdc46/Mcm family)
VLSEATYHCSECGEEIVVEVDPSAGVEQEYVEDCPVCCRPHLLHVSLGPQGEVELVARAE